MRHCIDDGRIGNVLLVRAAFGFAAPVIARESLRRPSGVSVRAAFGFAAPVIARESLRRPSGVSVRAAFGFAAPVMPQHRLFNPILAGGRLLDVGVYPLTIAHWLYGSHPSEYGVVGRVGETGVDEIVSFAASYPGGGRAQFGCATVTNLDFSAMIYGTAGSIEIPVFFAADRAILWAGGEEESEAMPHRANGFEYEIQEVVDCVRAGRTESERMPLALTLEMAGLCDEIRCGLGVVYPFEEGGS